MNSDPSPGITAESPQGADLKAGSRSGERLIVAVSASPLSTQLIRRARRMATGQAMGWIAVHVEGNGPLSAEERACLEANLSLARELGGEVLVTRGDDVAGALARVASETGSRQIVVGRQSHGGWRLRRGVVDRLLMLGGHADVHVMHSGPVPQAQPRRPFGAMRPVEAKEYALVLGVLLLITGAGVFLPSSAYLSVGFVYLFAVILLSLKVDRGPVLTAGVLSALVWDYLFIPPHFSLRITSLSDGFMLGTYLVIAVVAGQLTSRIRGQAHNERQREERASALLTLNRAIAEAKSLDQVIAASLRQIEELFEARTCILLSEGPEAPLREHPASSYKVEGPSRTAAEWAVHNRQATGTGTRSHSDLGELFLPLVRDDQSIGVLGLRLSETQPLTLGQRDLVEAFARQLSLSVERERFRAASEREKLLASSDKLHRALLDSVSHELRTPLAVIEASAEGMDSAGEEQRRELLSEIRAASLRLNRVVGNILDQTRLESGALRAHLTWCDANDLVNAALDATGDAMSGRRVEVEIPPEMVPIKADFALTEQCMANLLLNASMYTPPGTPVRIEVGLIAAEKRVFLAVADRGPGIPANLRGRLFKKFERAEPSRSGGLGLGLSIVAGFASAQGGDLVAEAREGGGARFVIYLPHVLPESPEQE